MLNIKPRTIYCRDNLDILQGINSSCIDLIYLDPPFNKKKVFTAPTGSSAEGAEFSDIFRQGDIKSEWVKSIEFENVEAHEYLRGVKGYSSAYNYCYLVYMAVRLIECHRVLKETGSVYLHCDSTMSHYIKLLLDCVFGERNFRNEIIWSYQGTGQPKKHFKRKHDAILFYAKTKSNFFSESGSSESISAFSKSKYTKQDSGGRYKEIRHPDGKIYTQYERQHQRMRDVWDIPVINAMAKERTGYPTQKPLALLERIILASSNKGDMVLDPFCGCATTCIAAEKLQRAWVGIDISHRAYELVNERLEREVPSAVLDEKPHYSTAPPRQTDRAAIKSGGFIYVISNSAFPDKYKVGIARDVDKRLNSYQTSEPERAYKVEYKKETPLYREIETAVHDSFTTQHEWVHADLAEIINKIESYAGR